MNQVKIDGYEMELAGCWDDLSKEQVLRLCKVLITGGADVRKYALMVLMNVTRGWIRDSNKVKFLRKLPNAVITYLSLEDELTGWIFQSAAVSHYHIQELNIGGKTWYGPPGDMLTISVAEFVECHSYYTAYIEKGTAGQECEDLLNRMIATLYRPGRLFYSLGKFSPGFKIDRRARSNEYRMEKRVLEIAKLSPELKMALFIQYSGAVEVFSKNFEHAFGSQGDGGDGGTWLKLLMEMSGDIFGNFEETQKVDVFTFFMKVDANIAKNKKLKKKLEKG